MYPADLHTHTIASGHAYATLTEMVRSAQEKGLSLLGITEHSSGIPGAPDDIYFQNLRVVPRELFGVRLLLGAEINIINYQGALDLPPRVIRMLDVRIAGIHSVCYRLGSMKENTRAVLAVLQNPSIDIIAHPDDGNCPLDYEAITAAAKEHHKILEINNNAMRMQSRKDVADNIRTILRLCMQLECPVLLGSDAHFTNDVGNFDQVEPLLQEVGFPDRLVLNRDPAAVLDFLAENRAREAALDTAEG